MATKRALIFLAASVMLAGTAFAYDRYNDGCNTCHGAFTDSTSTKGSTFPSGDKHAMHRASTSMNTTCNLCHRSDDGRNPFTGSSDGTALNPGVGCTGCHPAPGLRLHHINNGVTACADCHTNDPTPVKENIAPVYYGTADTKAANPCNAVATVGINENWTLNGFEGLDTDGDNLYDTADPDCQAANATPGEAGSGGTGMRVTAYNKATGEVTISYTPACAATGNHIERGALSALSTYAYAGQVCAIGNTGSATFAVPSGSFFLVVAENATVEGSYGKRKTGGSLIERPEDATLTTCPKPQNLALRCDP